MVNKCVDVLVGMQFGSEGKGKIVGYLAHEYQAAIRVGAPNAGHTVYFHGEAYKMRSIPCLWINPNARLYIGAGGMVNVHVLMKEIVDLQQRGVSVKDMLKIDHQCNVVTDADAHQEEKGGMFEHNGSTTEGVGVAQARKVLRRDAVLAEQVPELQPYLAHVAELVNLEIDAGTRIVIEGTQGFGLSLNHACYPYVTSRDVLASSMLSDSGLSPHVVRHVIGVFRTYPIRVAGNSGPLKNELTWEDVGTLSGYGDKLVPERTTVTKRIRRVGNMDWDLMAQAVKANRPDYLAMTFADYIDCHDAGCRKWGDLGQKTKSFIAIAEKRLGVPISIISTGPKNEDTVDIRRKD